MRSKNTAVTVSATLAALGLFAAGGCSGNSVSAIRGNLTPELQSPGRTYTEVANNVAIYNDLARREIFDDLASIVHADRPTRLTHYPVPY